MDLQTFKQLADEGYNRIPLMREVLADLETPLSVYLKFADGPYSYLFESVQGGEKWGRYSIIGLPARERIEVHGHEWRHFSADELLATEQVEDPLARVSAFAATHKVPEVVGLPRFNGGLVGYFGYDTVRYIEPRLQAGIKEDRLGNADILLLVSDEVLVFDNLRGKLYILVHVDPAGQDAYDRGLKRLDELAARLDEPLRATHLQERLQPLGDKDFVSGFTQEGFENAVLKAKEYIRDGDVMQVVLSQRLSAPYEGEPLNLYRALRSMNPSPYMYFVNLDHTHVVGSSPEILVRLENDEVTVRPIAGTRPRGATEEEDKALEADLLADPKEIAEHVMLIDLGRNDAGRVCKIGTVKVTEKMIIERYSHVMHIVSNVVGELADGLDAMDVLRATFPAGTVSGAPKVRAMEIIDELEPIKRGIYSGAVGYLGWNGNMDLAIAIRTAVIKDQVLHLQAGAGIVYDSVPRNEWEETMNKGRAVIRAAAKATSGLGDNPRDHA